MATITTVPTDYMGRPIGKRVTHHVDDGSVDRSRPAGRSVTAIMDWVGYDPDRAKAALVREHALANPRQSLIDQLDQRMKEIG